MGVMLLSADAVVSKQKTKKNQSEIGEFMRVKKKPSFGNDLCASRLEFDLVKWTIEFGGHSHGF